MALAGIIGNPRGANQSSHWCSWNRSGLVDVLGKLMRFSVMESARVSRVYLTSRVTRRLTFFLGCGGWNNCGSMLSQSLLELAIGCRICGYREKQKWLLESQCLKEEFNFTGMRSENQYLQFISKIGIGMMNMLKIEIIIAYSNQHLNEAAPKPSSLFLQQKIRFYTELQCAHITFKWKINNTNTVHKANTCMHLMNDK